MANFIISFDEGGGLILFTLFKNFSQPNLDILGVSQGMI